MTPRDRGSRSWLAAAALVVVVATTLGLASAPTAPRASGSATERRSSAPAALVLPAAWPGTLDAVLRTEADRLEPGSPASGVAASRLGVLLVLAVAGLSLGTIRPRRRLRAARRTGPPWLAPLRASAGLRAPPSLLLAA